MEQGEDLDSGRGHRHKVNAKVKSGLREIKSFMFTTFCIYLTNSNISEAHFCTEEPDD